MLSLVGWVSAQAVAIDAQMLRQQLLDTGRGRIVSLLQRGALTVDDIASALELSASGVRAQITAMERDGVVRRVGRRPGTTRPSQIFELTPEVEQLLSRAYIPLLTQLVDVFTDGLPAPQVDGLLREAGRKLAGALSAGRPSGTLRSRVMAASELLNEQLGAVTRVEQNGGYVIRGEGCPLSALTGKHPAVCRTMESLVKELVGASVHECCERARHPRCCFEIKSG
jgi:predicted ArsR family transcriptional regulator